MKAMTKAKKVTNKDRNVSVIIEEAALKNITVIVNNEKGRYAINLGDYLGAAIKHSIEVIEEAKKEKEKENDAEEKANGEDTTEHKEVHLS